MIDYWVVSVFNDVLEFEDIGMFDLIGEHFVLSRIVYFSVDIKHEVSHTLFL